MKKFLLFSLLSIFFITAFSDDAYAQRRGKKKKKKTSKTDEYFDESGFANKLWYGGMVNFSIGGDGFGNNTLLFGLSPMVGYKINDFFSIGPRVTMNYYEAYLTGDNLKVMELGVGVFGRAKFLASVFAHVEYETLNLNELSDFGAVEGSDDNFYLGLGYNSSMGGEWGYEILGLYNFQEEDERNVPIDFRVGITYKF